MAEPTTFPEEHVSESVPYRRISGFAIAGLLLSLAYCVLIVVAMLTAFKRHGPVLLPPWVQLLVFLAAGLSLAGRYFVSRSEGTVAGARIAALGLWISIVVGLGYGAYYAATYFAVSQQAEAFTLAWLEKMKEGKINSAFLDTQKPAVRIQHQAEDEEAMQRFNLMSAGPGQGGFLDMFRNNELIHSTNQGGQETQIEPLGIKDWGFEDGGYKISRIYEVKTPEGVADVLLTVLGTESTTQEFEGRQWQVLWNECRPVEGTKRRTDLGKRIDEYARQSKILLDSWAVKLGSLDRSAAVRTKRPAPDLAAAYLSTVEPPRRFNLARGYDVHFTVGVLAANLASTLAPTVPAMVVRAAALDPDLAAGLYMPGYYTVFHEGGLLKVDRKLIGSDEGNRFVIAGLRGMLGDYDPNSTFALMSFAPTSGARFWRMENGRLVYPHDGSIVFKPERGPPRFGAKVVIYTTADITSAETVAQTMRISSVELEGAEDMTLRQAPNGRISGPPTPGKAPLPTGATPPGPSRGGR